MEIGEIQIDMEDDRFMQDDRFWGLIGRTLAHEAHPERQVESLGQVLRELTPSELAAFELTFQRTLWWRAYTWDLWGAAHILNDGATDDGFEYFRCWLISKGREVFEATLADPDSLAGMIAPDAAPSRFEFEGIAYVATEVWGEKTGKDPWLDPTATFTGAVLMAEEPSGTPLEKGAGHLAKRYPKLWARFGRGEHSSTSVAVQKSAS